MKLRASTSINWIKYYYYLCRCIVLLLCISLHCVTSDNSNETSTAFPLYNNNTASSAATTKTQENEIIENISTTNVYDSAVTSPSPLPLIVAIKPKSTILSVVPATSEDVSQSTEKGGNVTILLKQKQQTTTTTTTDKQTTDLPTESTFFMSTITTTSSTTQSTTVEITTETVTENTSTTQMTTLPTTTTTQKPSAAPLEEDQCTKSHIVKLLPDPEFDSNRFSVNVTKGDITVTVISKRLTSAQFIVSRINELTLIRDNVTIGLRSIIIADTNVFRDVLEREVQFLKDCAAYPVGIFVSQDLWHLVKPSYKTINYNIWSFPTLDKLKYATFGKLLNELPWTQKNISVEIVSTDNDVKEDFVTTAATEKICLDEEEDDEDEITIKPNKTAHLRILLGDRAMKESSTTTKLPKNITTVGISFEPTRDYVSNLPQSAYFIAENEINLNAYASNKTRDTGEYNYNVLPTDFMVLGSMMLEITQWLNDSINSNCLQRNKHLGACSTIDQDTPQITYAYLNALPDMARTLSMPSIAKALNIELIEKRVVEQHQGGTVTELKPVAVVNLVNNDTKIYRTYSKYRNGTIQNNQKLGQFLSCSLVRIKKPKPTNPIEGYEQEFLKMFWRIRPETWVAAGLTTSCLGIVLCLTILTFLFSRICIQDVLEGNPTCSILLLCALILQFASFIPFSVEYTGYHQDMATSEEAFEKWNTHCSVKIFVVSLTYCLTFSLLLCRAVMLASIGSEGGFLSHVNGYIQSLICFFSTLVQVGLSTQLVVLMNTINKDMTCNDIYFGHWFWGIVGYDGFLLLMLVLLCPFVIKSQRNYKEGLLLVIGSILCLIVWCIWVPLCLMDNHSREAAIPLGAQATALAILGGILIPRSILIVKSIARSDLVQALPSLTSLAFAQAANQYASEQSMYDCVNPAMRNHLTRDEHQFADSDLEDHPSPSQVPTLPLRTNRNFGNINNYYRHQNGHTNLEFNDDSLRLNLPPSPDKMTRF